MVIRVVQSEGISHAVEEGKERDDVDRLRDLCIDPTDFAQSSDVGISNLRRPFGQDSSEYQKRQFIRRQRGGGEISLFESSERGVGGSLRPQEIGV